MSSLRSGCARAIPRVTVRIGVDDILFFPLYKLHKNRTKEIGRGRDFLRLMFPVFTWSNKNTDKSTIHDGSPMKAVSGGNKNSPHPIIHIFHTLSSNLTNGVCVLQGETV